MEAMACNQIENIKDEAIIEHELRFYLKYPEFVADINDRLRENELDIKYPVTRFGDTGVYRYCPGTEAQALKRIEVRENLTKGLERLRKRTERFNNAFKQLDEDEQDLLYMLYFEKMNESKVARFLGYKNTSCMNKARREALLKILQIYNGERYQAASEFRELMREKRKRKAMEWAEQQKRNRK